MNQPEGQNDLLIDEIISYLDEDDIKNMSRFTNGVEIRMGSEQAYLIYIDPDAGTINTVCKTKGIEFNLSSFTIADPECFDKIKKALRGEVHGAE